MVNKIVLQGRFVADPELKYTASNVSYMEFTIAWSERYKENERKCFLRCKAWRHTAEFISKYFRKGQETVIEGQMITEQWETDGKTKSRVICNVEHVHFAGSKRSDGESSNQTPRQPVGNDGFMYVPDDVDDELPFN